ncbi:MarR family transcriptional regulator [Bacillus sonorensis]|uniref:HTH-type transcriptional regulator YwoH n=2 Tax=Bacillus sonorensis TaxID=119858 RepID=M5P035_9BACI|nr:MULTISPECIES: MarR family transcriptional regulator [Bacillus]TWK80643.1 putative HTH-type transcriptional regulator/GBAA_1941/BAS1801 [Bacillus paralicheniformis]ASB87067.1 putative HTH-type transcriptional regulator YwoH [Bacillus sonorensis]EME73446.1 HTH-type transcriptional regulator YwoH [Bacillus sonorensis L12]MBG9914424.1 MarR family transcriptional regulator [Bacillus sonorensis]MCF7616319.1 MarR family transcriptional regulator [Bacillus sonorensis]
MEHINRTLIHLMNQSARKLSKKTNEQLEAFGLFGAQWSILYCLHTYGPMTQKDIWTYLHVEAPTVTRTINRLEKNGWVQRIQGEDKREKVVKMTDAAVLKYDDIQLKMKEFEEEVLSSFDEKDKKMFHRLLQQLLTDNEKEM